jgi:hypothetical protein
VVSVRIRYDARYQILCPNCHSQTKTYSGKKCIKELLCQVCNKKIKKSKYSKKKYCDNCRSTIKKTTISRLRKFDPSKEELLLDMETMSFCAMGRKYGVSDNAVRKRCKKYGLL